MATKKTSKHVKTKSAKKKMRKADIILITGCIILAIPFLILGWFLVSASLDTGKPIIGDRYENNLDPAITKAQLSEIEDRVSGLSGVEKATVDMATATLRVNVDISDTASKDEALSMASQAYNEVIAVLDENTYFSQANGMKMYDCEVHVYNVPDSEKTDNFVYVIQLKTSNMEKASQQVVSEPVDAELAQQLRDDLEKKNNPQPTEEAGDITVGSGEVEETPATETAE
ncbi:MAG: hypothetical protein MR210_03285 [Erysipelotrichaceae bacterium]|nr:hypothetical protein [Erysipelotrichaceae bacterium]MDY5251992.1 hypothetical protein [Erysipelotrichaceae bacterium]